MPMTAPDFDRYFTPGHSFVYESGESGTLAVAVAGELWLPSGEVIACDPFVSLGGGWTKPFTTRVAPGRYRVETAIATLVTPGADPGGRPHLRTAAARLVIRDTATASWEHAVTEGQDVSGLGDGEFFGYGVDAGAAASTTRPPTTPSRTARATRARSGTPSKEPATAPARTWSRVSTVTTSPPSAPAGATATTRPGSAGTPTARSPVS